MAATIARAQGYNRDGSTRTKAVTRLGHGSAEGQANTYATFATVTVDRTGRGWVTVEQDGKEIHRYEWGPEASARKLEAAVALAEETQRNKARETRANA